MVYSLMPMRGTRAGILTAVLSRAPAARVPFWPLQQLVWQIEGGLSYDEMPPQSQQLIDRLVPEYQSQLRQDFLKQMQSTCGKFARVFPGMAGICGPVNALELDYQRIHQALIQNENNYQALAQQFVHVIPGNAPYSGPAYWSRVNPQVYERLVGGSIYGETGKLEIRVLPSSGAGLAMDKTKGLLRNATYVPQERQSLNGTPSTDPADVPVCSSIFYPNQTAQQVLGCEPEGGPTVQLDTPVVNGLSVTVNGSATPGTSGAPIKQIAWNWGDGTPDQISGFPGTHAYSQAGNHTITATATDGNGATGSAQANVRVNSILEGTRIWVATAQSSSATNVAGQITLDWNAPGATDCTLAVTPDLPSLLGPLSVPCQEATPGRTALIPLPTGQVAQAYSFTLDAISPQGIAKAFVTVYALPKVSYGMLGQPFSSVSYTPVQPLSSCSQAINVLGCWGEFGLKENSLLLSTGLSDGISEAGIVGYNYVAGGDVDEVSAIYNPLADAAGSSGYTEYLNVSAQESLASFGLCNVKILGGAITLQEGGAGLASYIVAGDSTGLSYSGVLSPDYCANLLTPNPQVDAFESAIEEAFDLGRTIGSTPRVAANFWQDYRRLSVSLLRSAGVPTQLQDAVILLLQAVSAVSPAVLAAAKVTANIGISASSTGQLWAPVVTGAQPYTFSAGSATLAVEIGFGLVGEVSGVVTRATISGIAVPGDPPSARAIAALGARSQARPNDPIRKSGSHPRAGVSEIVVSSDPPPNRSDAALRARLQARPKVPIPISASHAGEKARAAAVRLTGRTAMFSWQPDHKIGTLGYLILWAFRGEGTVHLASVSSDTTSYTITDLQPGKVYVIGVVPKLRMGLGPYACVVMGANRGTRGVPCPKPTGSSTLTSAAGSVVATRGGRNKPASRGDSLSLEVGRLTSLPGGIVTVSGCIRNPNGGTLAHAGVELTASEGGTNAPPVTATITSDGSFRLTFTAPPTPGIVTITARIAGMPNSPVATATLQVVPKR